MKYEIVITSKYNSKKLGDYLSFKEVINQLNEIREENKTDFIKIEIFKYEADNPSMDNLVEDITCNINNSYQNLKTFSERLKETIYNTYKLNIDIINRMFRYDLFLIRKDNAPFLIIISTEGVALHEYSNEQSKFFHWDKINKDYEAFWRNLSNMITEKIAEFEIIEKK